MTQGVEVKTEALSVPGPALLKALLQAQCLVQDPEKSAQADRQAGGYRYTPWSAYTVEGRRVANAAGIYVGIVGSRLSEHVGERRTKSAVLRCPRLECRVLVAHVESGEAMHLKSEAYFGAGGDPSKAEAVARSAVLADTLRGLFAMAGADPDLEDRAEGRGRPQASRPRSSAPKRERAAQSEDVASELKRIKSETAELATQLSPEEREALKSEVRGSGVDPTTLEGARAMFRAVESAVMASETPISDQSTAEPLDPNPDARLNERKAFIRDLERLFSPWAVSEARVKVGWKLESSTGEHDLRLRAAVERAHHRARST